MKCIFLPFRKSGEIDFSNLPKHEAKSRPEAPEFQMLLCEKGIIL